jgi:hypothetical protein
MHATVYSHPMRDLTFIWFWHICWDENNAWTLLFAFFLPLVPILVLSELLRFAGSLKLSHLSVLECMSVTAFICEFILKPSIDAIPDPEACDASAQVPCTAAAISLAATIVYAVRYVSSGPKDLLTLILWGVTFILTYIARPMLHYLSHGHQAISWIPGIVMGVFWSWVIEKKAFEATLLAAGNVLKLENDISGENFQKEQDLLPPP